MYLGLSSRNWCNKADKKLCTELMDYFLASGSFRKNIAKKKIRQQIDFAEKAYFAKMGKLPK